MENTTRRPDGTFLPGAGGRRKGYKNTITEAMLKQYAAYEQEYPHATPIAYWCSLLKGEVDMTSVQLKDQITIKMKAAEYIAKYVYDSSFDTEEVSTKLEMTSEQIEALKAAFPSLAK